MNRKQAETITKALLLPCALAATVAMAAGCTTLERSSVSATPGHPAALEATTFPLALGSVRATAESDRIAGSPAYDMVLFARQAWHEAAGSAALFNSSPPDAGPASAPSASGPPTPAPQASRPRGLGPPAPAPSVPRPRASAPPASVPPASQPPASAPPASVPPASQPPASAPPISPTPVSLAVEVREHSFLRGVREIQAVSAVAHLYRGTSPGEEAGLLATAVYRGESDNTIVSPVELHRVLVELLSRLHEVMRESFESPGAGEERHT